MAWVDPLDHSAPSTAVKVPSETADSILAFLKESAESNRMLNEEIWLDAAFNLNLLLGDEHTALEDSRQVVAKKKLEILKVQEKKNVAAADIEIEASDEYRAMKLQQHKVDRIEEFIRIAKKNASQF